jgi:putative SOS response-associated peptidase YedK
MPVLLRQPDQTLWLDRSLQDESAVYWLLRPYPSHLLSAYAVGDGVNDVRRNGRDLVLPRKEPIVPQLALPI